ncbi:RING-H2 finger protein ATL79 [Rhynchospora pubera]|uniref:RING-H2 finger protein ATL79 n=1 Tax=Rhynchospora pubera TaxID=906938 RepID=A0AAV8H2K1_9POAL|nr:RING-H2 finger protein ATL79 [Rhynchospora pubera]
MPPQPNYTSTSSWPQPSPSPPSKSAQVSKWGPSSNPKTFDANMLIILIILACAAALAFSLHAAGRLILRLITLRRHSASPNKTQNGSTSGATSSPIVFSAEMRLARAEAECAICLSEFLEGERVRVLPNCGHGFHAICVEEWIVTRSNCPTCRTTCHVGNTTSEEP